MWKETLKTRVETAARDVIQHQGSVSPVDVLLGVGFLQPANLSDWKHGREESLEDVIQAGSQKVAFVLDTFHRWANLIGLERHEDRYTRMGRNGEVELRLSGSGDPVVERAFRTAYVSPELSPVKKKNLRARRDKPPEILVYSIIRDSTCGECGASLIRGDFLYPEAEEAYCLGCAGMQGLEFLPSGDAALTRRAKKYSSKWAVVLRFSRARKRYERQGLLVEAQALERAEHECADDAGSRKARRESVAKRRVQDDAEFGEAMFQRIVELFPGCPPDEARQIAAHTAVRGSGRVGRTADGRMLAEKAVTLAVVAAVRHRHTRYDRLLADGLDRRLARSEVNDKVDELIESWRRT